MAELQKIEASDVAGIEAALAADGGCIALNLLPEALCDRLMTDFGQHLEDMTWGEDELGYKQDFYGARTKRLHGLFSKSTAMVDVLTHPVLLAVANDILVKPGKAKGIRLSNTELMVLGSEQSEQMFHTDGVSWREAQSMLDQEILVSANIALTEFTSENGATRVVPGSHLWDTHREPEPQEICQAVMPKGAALVYSGNIVHSGGANKTDALRVGLYLGYVMSWLRPIENQLVTNTPADIHALPEPARELLDVCEGGFTVYA